jgi:anti-sigma factor RsiW
MRQSRAAHDGKPRPELLAAYVDGELDEAARARIETWLAAHPEVQAEVEAQRQLIRLWHEAVPPEPTAGQWQAALARLEAALTKAEPASARTKTGGGRSPWVAAASLAAAVLLGGTWYAVREASRPTPSGPEGPLARPHIETLPVLSPDEVEIISVDAADSGLLVVGEPPVQGPLILASASDIDLTDAPDMGSITEDPNAPMILAPKDTPWAELAPDK